MGNWFWTQQSTPTLSYLEWVLDALGYELVIRRKER